MLHFHAEQVDWPTDPCSAFLKILKNPPTGTQQKAHSRSCLYMNQPLAPPCKAHVIPACVGIADDLVDRTKATSRAEGVREKVLVGMITARFPYVKRADRQEG